VPPSKHPRKRKRPASSSRRKPKPRSAASRPRGQAAATFARLDAEARGQYEILAKKGDGLRKIIDACGGAQQAFQLLMLEHLDSLTKTAAQAISNIKFDKVIVWEGGNGNGHANGTSNTTNFLQSMARSMPPMMQILRTLAGVELPEFIASSRPTRAPPQTISRPLRSPKPPPQRRLGKVIDDHGASGSSAP